MLLNLSQAYRGVGDYKKSAEVLDKLKKTFGDDTILKPKLLLAEGTLSYFSNNFKKAEELYSKALETSIKLNRDFTIKGADRLRYLC